MEVEERGKRKEERGKRKENGPASSTLRVSVS
jgi:hypothetical protein